MQASPTSNDKAKILGLWPHYDSNECHHPQPQSHCYDCAQHTLYSRRDLTIFDRFTQFGYGGLCDPALRIRQIMAYVCSAGRKRKVQAVAA